MHIFMNNFVWRLRSHYQALLVLYKTDSYIMTLDLCVLIRIISSIGLVIKPETTKSKSLNLSFKLQNLESFVVISIFKGFFSF